MNFYIFSELGRLLKIFVQAQFLRAPKPNGTDGLESSEIYKSVDFKTEDNQILKGLISIPEIINQETEFYLVCHGKGIDRFNAWKLAKLERFKNLNAVVLIFDYRGFAGSTGQFSVQDVNLDMNAGVEYLKGLAHSNIPSINFIGHSLGAGIILEYFRYLKDKENNGNNEKIFQAKNIYLFAPFTTILDCLINFKIYRYIYYLIPSYISRLLPGDLSYDNYNNIEAVDCPLHLFHGSKDELIPSDHSKALAEKSGSSDRLVIIDGLDHDKIFRDDDCWEVILKNVPEACSGVGKMLVNAVSKRVGTINPLN